MTDITSMHLREELPPDIVRWANLESTMNDLFNVFSAWREKDAKLFESFLNESYFRWEESLIDKLIEIKPSITFDEIQDEWINLASVRYNNKLTRELKDCLDKTNDDIKKQFVNEISNKVQAIIWTNPPYVDFTMHCPAGSRDTDVIWYLEVVVNYLEEREDQASWKKAIDVLKHVIITNNDLNWGLIPPWIPLSAIPTDIRNAFDHLLSFEIGKEADRTLNIVNNITEKLWWLFSNSFPAINTIISESPEYKYEESKLGPDFETRKQAINNDKNLTSLEKKERINDLKRDLYIKYLKTENSKIGNALEQLYKNNFDYSKLDPNVLKDYIDRVVDLRVRKLFDDWINTVIKINYVDMDEFTKFYKELANVTNSTMRLTNVSRVNTRTDPFIDIAIHKNIVGWENPRLNDIEQYSWNAKAFDTIPLKYEINKSDIDNLQITLEDRAKLLKFLSRFKTEGDKYVIEWKDVWMLIYLFFVINNRPRITTFDPDKQKAVEEAFWKVKPSERKEKMNDAEKFKNDIEKMWTWVKFEDWAEIWMPMWDSDLPWWWYQWMRVKISDVDMKKWTFKGRVFWWELKFASNLEWKARTFDMNDETIKKFKGISKDPNKVRLLPNPNKNDFNSFRSSRLQNKLWTADLNFPLKWTTWDGDKFINEKWEKINYFWTSWDNKSVYKIEYNPIRNCFKVSSVYNWKEKWKDWKYEDKRFSYSRDMDWNNFLIFFTQKWLTPQTEEEAGDIVNKNEQEFKMLNGGHRKLNWFSISNIKNAFKALKWNIKKKIDDYNKRQDEKLEDILIWDWWLYSKLAWVLGFIPSMKEGLWELEQEYYNERDNRTWKKIEYYLKIFQADPDFWTTFENIPPHARIQWWKSLQKTITDRVANAKDSMWDPWIYQAAALLLANIEKWWSPYRWLSWQENSWLWVKALLGKAHYEQFLRDKQKCIDDLKEAWKEKDQIQDVLATCEMDYIINNVSWANWKLKYFGCHEWRWIPGQKGTEYIDNPSKRLLSNQFADKLKSSYKWRFNSDAVNSAFDNIKHNDFNLAREDFKKLIKSSRFPWAIANLKKMFLLAKTPEQQSDYQKCFLLYMLSGVLDINGKKDLRKQTYQRAKTMSFLPGMLAKETSHSEKVALLLDDWSWWDFSRNVKSYFREWDLIKWNLKIDWDDGLIAQLDSRWTVDKMKDFEKYSKSDFLSKSFPKDSVLWKLQVSALNTDMENIDNSLLNNPLVANSWWLLSNINVVDDRILFKNWEFEWKDPDERNNRKEFWIQINKEIRQKNANNLEDVKLLLNQYFNRFKFSDREEIYKWVKTASNRKWEIWKEKFYQNEEWFKDSMWVISEKEIESIIRYAFKWHTMYNRFNGRLPDELNDVLDAFQDKFQQAFTNNMFERPEIISEVFDIGNAGNIQPYWLWSWSKYNWAVTGREYIIDDEGWTWDPKDARKKERNRVKRNFTSWNFINKKIADMENSFKKLPDKQYKSYINATLNDLMSRFSDAE